MDKWAKNRSQATSDCNLQLKDWMKINTKGTESQRRNVSFLSLLQHVRMLVWRFSNTFVFRKELWKTKRKRRKWKRISDRITRFWFYLNHNFEYRISRFSIHFTNSNTWMLFPLVTKDLYSFSSYLSSTEENKCFE